MINTAFVEEEAGAVTVDWVVMTAALVGLGLAVSSVVSAGVRKQSEDVEATLLRNDIIKTTFGAVVTVLADVTEAMTGGTAYATGGSISVPSSVDKLSFRMEATLGGTNGILWETGGGGRGTILYEHDGTLYFQAGDGGANPAEGARGEAAWTIETGGTYTIEGSADANGGLALYVNGALVDSDAFVNPQGQLTGGNTGGVGLGVSSVANNRGGYGAGEAYGHAGAGELTLFTDQTTADIPGS